MSTVHEPDVEERFREVLGWLPAGVTVITSISDGVPVGVACNSFTSASLRPPLVAFFVARTSSTWPHVRRAGRFVANVLSIHQAELCRAFARKFEDRFAGVDWSPGVTGAPRIDGAVAWIDCNLFSVTDAGDHWLVLGEVRHLEASSEEPPLVFFRGAYRQLTP